MKNKSVNNKKNKHLLYYKTREDIQIYKTKPAALKFQWLEAQMEFFYKAMPEKAKRIRDMLRKDEV